MCVCVIVKASDTFTSFYPRFLVLFPPTPRMYVRFSMIDVNVAATAVPVI